MADILADTYECDAQILSERSEEGISKNVGLVVVAVAVAVLVAA